MQYPRSIKTLGLEHVASDEMRKCFVPHPRSIKTLRSIHDPGLGHVASDEYGRDTVVASRSIKTLEIGTNRE